ncbi:hypothetical protein HYPSUDRAFT_38391 [Hypholoma sublateritium FD-334 SS-4]|uniref:F-box domain-containing protein n=1 Tax=Hypholoma sublateritium (strain FD-334 SS-4) TaxID=945553 RepID=A0A0D2MLK0_HYPSF|nr:hypothetical protein HYPSUDRAFT_38391 [Hypholoma sublateritium FD-334 SS-4]
MASLRHLLTTNQALTDHERVRLKETVAEYDDKLNLITQKISALEEQLRILNAEKTALLEASAPFRRALSPFRQLPEDVVRVIFVACLETRWNPTMAKTEAPVLLTQISRATRMIALTTPELWAAIHIPIILSTTPETEDTAKSIMTARTEGAKEWLLRRSGNLPLHISVYENREFSQIETTRFLGSEFIDDLIHVIIACRSRWKNVHFSCNPTTISHVSMLNQYDVPLLQSLSVSTFTTPNGQSRGDFWRNSDILQAPMLKKFRQMGSGGVSTYPVNWPNLTHLYCDHLRFDIMNDLVHVLRQATHLIRLDLIVTDAGWPPSLRPISLPHLTTLVFIGLGAAQPIEHGEGMLGSINAPSLEIISYNSAMYDVARSPALIACLKQSSNIRELSTGQPSSCDILIEYLSHCPSLLTLHIPAPERIFAWQPQLNRNINTVLNALTQNNPAQCLCPQLEYFRYGLARVVSLPALRDFLVRRNGTIPGLSRLKALVMDFEYDPIEEPLLKGIQSAETVGNIRLEVTFRKTIADSLALDRGISHVTSPVDDWWPSRIVDDMTYLC